MYKILLLIKVGYNAYTKSAANVRKLVQDPSWYVHLEGEC